MEYKQFDKIRLTTQMNEMVHVYNTTVYKSVKASAKTALAGMQEQYKHKFGEYSADHVIVENEVSEDAKKFETISVQTLIDALMALKEKHGDCDIQINGTLMCEKDGNSIIVSTEKQM